MRRRRQADPLDGRARVVTLVDGLGRGGGAEHLALEIATRLDPERFASTLCVSRWPVEYDPQGRGRAELEDLARAGVRFLPLGREAKLDVWTWGRLARYLRRESVDVLHAHKFGSNVWGTLAGMLARVPVIVAHEHTWSYEGGRLRRFLDRELIARGADVLVAVSREDRRRMTAVERIQPRSTMFIPNGVPAMAARSGHDVRSELGIPPQAPVIGAVGALRAQKAHQVLLRATVELAVRHPDIQVLLVGDGPERSALERLAGELGVRDSVRFLGLRGDVPDVLAVLDLAVCCSDYEGSPLAVMEYMDAALAVVATAVGGVPDLIEHGVHGLLVPSGEPHALALAIAELLADPARRAQMGARARQRRRTEFDIDTLIRRLEDLYLELLARHPPARGARAHALGGARAGGTGDGH